MAQRERIYPDAGADLPTAPAPPGSYYSVKDLNQMPPPATYQQRRRGRGPCCCCFLWLCSIVTTLIVLLGIAVLVFWLVVRPKAPDFDVNKVFLDPSFLATTSGPRNTNITYSITAGNPNKHMGFYYSDISVFVQANGNEVARGTVPDFYQGHRNTTYIDGEIGETNVNLDQNTLNAISKNTTYAPFYAQVDLKAKLKIGSIKTGKIKVKVKCDIYLDLQQTQNQLAGRNCKVKW